MMNGRRRSTNIRGVYDLGVLFKVLCILLVASIIQEREGLRHLRYVCEIVQPLNPQICHRSICTHRRQETVRALM
jgi:hypothetical protein